MTLFCKTEARYQKKEKKNAGGWQSSIFAYLNFCRILKLMYGIKPLRVLIFGTAIVEHNKGYKSEQLDKYKKALPIIFKSLPPPFPLSLNDII